MKAGLLGRPITTSRLSIAVWARTYKLFKQTALSNQQLSRSYWSTSRSYPAGNMSPRTSIEDFQDLVRSSDRILSLCGAGLSAASGLPTFRGSGGLWRNHEPTSLATPEAFKKDPALVWLFYAWRRHMCLKADPNQGHYALAELARKKENFLCLTQNVDGESAPLLWLSFGVCANLYASQGSLSARVTPPASFAPSTAASWTSSASTRSAPTSKGTTCPTRSARPSRQLQPWAGRPAPSRAGCHSWTRPSQRRRSTSRTFLTAPAARQASCGRGWSGSASR